jgi:hypothetical protein
MAVKGSGTVKQTIDPVMVTPETLAPINPRAGAAKKTQTKFPIKPGMTDMVEGSVSTFAGPKNPGVGPDASSANPLDPEPKDKNLVKQRRILTSTWGMKDANGNGVDNDLGANILDEAGRLGKPITG